MTITKIITAPVCDFCAAKLRGGSAFSFPALDAPLGVPDLHRPGHWQHSKGDWLACDTCRAMIVAGKRGRLANRAVNAIVATNPDAQEWMRPKLHEAIRETHDQFWSHRDGPPRRMDQDALDALVGTPAEYITPVDGPPRKVANWLQTPFPRSPQS